MMRETWKTVVIAAAFAVGLAVAASAGELATSTSETSLSAAALSATAGSESGAEAASATNYGASSAGYSSRYYYGEDSHPGGLCPFAKKAATYIGS